MTSWLREALTPTQADCAPADPVEPGAIPVGIEALDFMKNGAPIGDQRTRAVKAARNFIQAGYTVDETADGLWAGLQQNNDPTEAPWTYPDAYAIADNISRTPAPPLKPLLKINVDTSDIGDSAGPVIVPLAVGKVFVAFSVDELLAAADDAADIVIADGGDGFVLSMDGKMAIAGPTGVGKSNLLLRLGRQLAEGSAFLRLAIPQPRRVLDLAAEGSKRGTRKRLAKIWDGASVEAKSRYHLALVQLDLMDDGEALDALLDRHRPEVLMIDPMRNAHNLDENSSQDMARLTAVLDGIIARHHCALVVAHHDRKQSPFVKQETSVDSVRGSTAFTGWLSACLSVRRKPHQPDILLADWVKVRDAEEALPALELEFLRSTIDFRPETRSEAADVEPMVINAVFHNVELTKAEIVEIVRQGTAAGKRAIENAVVSLANQERLLAFIKPEHKKSRTKTYRLPPEKQGTFTDEEEAE